MTTAQQSEWTTRLSVPISELTCENWLTGESPEAWDQVLVNLPNAGTNSLRADFSHLSLQIRQLELAIRQISDEVRRVAALM